MIYYQGQRPIVFQLCRRDENRYLLLIAFVTHQFYKLNDVLVNILLQTCQTALNATIKDHKEMLYESRRSRYQLISELSNTFRENLVILKKIEVIVQGEELTDEQKVEAVREIVPLDFLKVEEQDAIFNEKGKLRLSLYKILLFEEIASAIKSGALNLLDEAAPRQTPR